MKHYREFYQAVVSESSFSASGDLVDLALGFARTAANEHGTIVLVEGVSDYLALNTLAERRGMKFEEQNIAPVPIGGARNVGQFLNLLGPRGLDVKPCGLCDAGEEPYFRRALERARFGSNLTRSEMEALGFYVCEADLEDELIRCLGVDAVMKVMAAEGDLGAFRTLQKQPAWEDQGEVAQMRRWLGATARRKFRYARLLAEALDLDHVPPPLDGLLIHVSST